VEAAVRESQRQHQQRQQQRQQQQQQQQQHRQQQGAEDEPGVAEVTFSSQDFPSVGSGGSAAAGTVHGRWTGCASSSSFRNEDFPSLPSLSRKTRHKVGYGAGAAWAPAAGPAPALCPSACGGCCQPPGRWRWRWR
jgi:hypothetical protein